MHKPKLKIQNLGLLLSAIFYLIVGIILLAALVLYNLELIHFAVIGVLSLITAFGLFITKKWTIWFVTGLFFISNVFSIFNLNYALFLNDVTLQTAFTVYLVLSWIATIYVLARRKNLS